MIYAIVGGLLIVGGLIALTVALVQRHVCAEVEPYHPLFAESPDPAPVQPVEPEPLIDWQRAKYFTEEEAAQLQATATAPVVVAGTDLEMSLLIGEIYGACNDYRDGRDPCAGAVREPSPEVKR